MNEKTRAKLEAENALMTELLGIIWDSRFLPAGGEPHERLRCFMADETYVEDD